MIEKAVFLKRLKMLDLLLHGISQSGSVFIPVIPILYTEDDVIPFFGGIIIIVPTMANSLFQTL